MKPEIRGRVSGGEYQLYLRINLSDMSPVRTPHLYPLPLPPTPSPPSYPTPGYE
jgi:hypothetical protein